jgi:hypothetical protein
MPATAAELPEIRAHFAILPRYLAYLCQQFSAAREPIRDKKPAADYNKVFKQRF